MSLVTRFYGPNAKGSKLTIKEMDDNLYYLQSLGVSGITYQNNTLSFINPTGGTKDILINDIYTTGATYNSGVIYFDRNDQLSAYTVNISSLTGDVNTFATAFTYNNLTNTLTITDNTNTSLDSYIDSFSGLTVNGNLNVNTISATTYQNLPLDVYVTGGTFFNGTVSFTNNSGNTFDVTGLTNVDTYVTGLTYNDNTFTIKQNNGKSDINSTFNTLTGLTVNGLLSATTYQNLPQDIFVTGGTYTNGEILFKNNSGGSFTVSGLPIGGVGGEVYYLNLSQTQIPYQEFSPIGTNLTEQTTGITINSGVTSTIASFLTPVGYPNTITIPAGFWGFYLHSYKDVVNASFDIFCEVYVYTTGGTETLILTTEGADVTTYSPTVSMEFTDGYYSGGTIDVTDRILVKVRATNNGSQTNTLSFFTEGEQHYSYGITPFSNFNSLRCDTLSGCTTIINLENNKVNKNGDTMTGTLILPTISATTYQNLPDNVTGNYLPLSGGTVTGLTLFQNGITANTISATTYQNLPIDPDTYTTGFTYLNNTFTIKQNNGKPNINSTFNTLTGLTVNGNLSATTATITNRSGTPSQAASFDTNGKLVAGLGQTTFSAFGSATLSITSSVTTFTVLPGVTQTITVPANCSVLIMADGGMNTTSTVTTSIASIDVAIFIDGAYPTNGGYRRVSAHNPSGSAVNSTGIPWSLSTIQTLTPGTHTIDVRAVYTLGSTTSVSSNNTNARQAGLYITIIKN